MKSKKEKSEIYTDEELEGQIRHGIIYSDSPKFVRDAVMEKQRTIEAEMKSDEEEMADFMEEMGGTPRLLSSREERHYFERQEDEEKISWIKRLLIFFTG